MLTTARHHLFLFQSRLQCHLRARELYGPLCRLHDKLQRVEDLLTQGEHALWRLALRLLLLPCLARLLKLSRTELVLCLNNGAIGHLSVEPERAIRENLTAPKAKKQIILLNRSVSVNPFLDTLWRREFSCINISYRWQAICQNISFNFSNQVIKCDYFNGADNLQRSYRRALALHDNPLLHFTPDEIAHGEELLREMGIDKDDGFVCLHAREGGFKPRLTYHSYRDVDINSYLPAIRSLIDKGVKVVRLGDASMKPFPPLDGMIDYPHTHFKSDFLDIFLCGSCTFLVGTNSGMSHVATLFGVRSCHLNVVPFTCALTKDIFIPKLIFDKENRLLSFRDQQRAGCWNFSRMEQYVQAGLTIHDNTSEEIQDAVEEMYARVLGTPLYDEEDSRRAQKAASIWERELDLHPGVGSRLGREFARQYGSALLEE